MLFTQDGKFNQELINLLQGAHSYVVSPNLVVAVKPASGIPEVAITFTIDSVNQSIKNDVERFFRESGLTHTLLDTYNRNLISSNGHFEPRQEGIYDLQRQIVVASTDFNPYPFDFRPTVWYPDNKAVLYSPYILRYDLFGETALYTPPDLIERLMNGTPDHTSTVTGPTLQIYIPESDTK